jgi:hypothetical protein
MRGGSPNQENSSEYFTRIRHIQLEALQIAIKVNSWTHCALFEEFLLTLEEDMPEASEGDDSVKLLLHSYWSIEKRRSIYLRYIHLYPWTPFAEILKGICGLFDFESSNRRPNIVANVEKYTERLTLSASPSLPLFLSLSLSLPPSLPPSLSLSFSLSLSLSSSSECYLSLDLCLYQAQFDLSFRQLESALEKDNRSPHGLSLPLSSLSNLLCLRFHDSLSFSLIYTHTHLPRLVGSRPIELTHRQSERMSE